MNDVMEKEKEGFSVDIPADVKTRFLQFVEAEGVLKYRAVVAALELVQRIPPQLFRDLVRGDDKAVNERLSKVQWEPSGWTRAVTARQAAERAASKSPYAGKPPSVPVDQQPAAGKKKQNLG